MMFFCKTTLNSAPLCGHCSGAKRDIETFRDLISFFQKKQQKNGGVLAEKEDGAEGEPPPCREPECHPAVRIQRRN